MWVFTGNGKKSTVSGKTYNGVKYGLFKHGSRHRTAQLKRFNKHPSRFRV